MAIVYEILDGINTLGVEVGVGCFVCVWYEGLSEGEKCLDGGHEVTLRGSGRWKCGGDGSW